MRNVIRVILWIAYIIFAIYIIDKTAHEAGIVAFIFGIPAAIIGGAA